MLNQKGIPEDDAKYSGTVVERIKKTTPLVYKKNRKEQSYNARYIIFQRMMHLMIVHRAMVNEF